jgi:hypothetical protein
MNTFGGSTPQEKAMSKLIHDTNQASSEMKFTTDKLTEWLTDYHKALPIELREKFSSAPYVRIEYLKKWHKEMISAIDTYIEKFKNDFPES